MRPLAGKPTGTQLVAYNKYLVARAGRKVVDVTARKDVIDQVTAFFPKSESRLAGMLRTSQALAARREAREGEQHDDDDEEGDASAAAVKKTNKVENWQLVIAGNSKECFRNPFRNIHMVALATAILKSKLSGIRVLDFCYNHLGEEHDFGGETETSGESEHAHDERKHLLDAAPCLGRLLQSTTLYTSTIEELNLSGNRLGGESCSLLCAALRDNNATLHSLNLDNPVIKTKEGRESAWSIQHVGKMLQVDETLRTISLCKHQLTDDGAQVLAERLLDNHTLQCLVLRANHIGSTGASALAALVLNRDSLAQLDLSANRIGDADAHAFAQVLQRNRSNLSTLALCSTYLTDDGLTATATACQRVEHPEVNRLQILLLWGNDFRERSAQLFLELCDGGRFHEWDVETDSLPRTIDGDDHVHVAHKDVVRAAPFASPKR